jgi:predicted O-linked N-acetylglucosamine transferase (SPINDLY family)
VPLRSLWKNLRLARTRPDERIERAHDLAEAGRDAEAQALCREILAARPEQPRVLHLQGILALRGGQPGAAQALIGRAIAQDPDNPLFRFNLGNALAAQGAIAAAADAFGHAARLKPDYLPAQFNLGKAQLELGRPDAAIAALQQAHRIAPADSDVLAELGTACYRKAESTHLLADYAPAIDALQQLLARPGIGGPVRSNALLFLGDALDKSKRHGEALTLLEQLLVLEPDNLDALAKASNCYCQMGRMAEALPYSKRVVQLAPDNLAALSAIICTTDYLPGVDAAANSAQRLALARQFSTPKRRSSWCNTRDPARRLRLGYVSPDLRTHVAMVLFEPVLRLHDRNAFELFVYDATVVRDRKTDELRALVPNWREIDKQPTGALPQLVEDDGIDILVDLAGHTPNNRLMSFAFKPAPVQASWLAYPGSTGLAEIDYLISDPHTSPPQFDHHASETVWRLPHTRFCYQPPAALPEPATKLPGRPVTFGSFNNISKLNLEVLDLWRRILAAVPDSRLLIKSFSIDDPEARRRFESDLATAGLPASRVELRGASTYLDNFADYGEIDIALDPFPFCGGLTSLDALWMGVPVVTLEQELMAGRQTISFLGNIDHREWIANSKEDYVRIAAELARTPQHLATYRTTLRDAVRHSALMDFAGFTRDLEQAYRSMWKRWAERE